MGVKFKGIHSDTFGIEQISSRRPIMSDNRDTYVDIPFRNGSLVVQDGSRTDIIVEVTFKIRKKSTNELFDTLLEIKQWLTTNGREKLIFDDYPSMAYMGKVSSGIEFEKVMSTGTFTVAWRCLPDMVNALGVG